MERGQTDMPTSKKSSDDDEPRIVVSKVTPQLVSLWNKELERLHRTLTSAEADETSKSWAKDQIAKLHKLVFGTNGTAD